MKAGSVYDSFAKYKEEIKGGSDSTKDLSI